MTPSGGEDASDQEEHDETGEQDHRRAREKVHPHQVLQNAEEFGLLHADIGDAEDLVAAHDRLVDREIDLAQNVGLAAIGLVIVGTPKS